jgi:hypothetical protein
MYIIRKIVCGNSYYWNDKYHRWEGLEDNATKINRDRLDVLMGSFLLKDNAKEYSFFKMHADGINQ